MQRQFGVNKPRLQRDDNYEGTDRRPEHPRVARAAVMHRSFRLEREVGRAVRR